MLRFCVLTVYAAELLRKVAKNELLQSELSWSSHAAMVWLVAYVRSLLRWRVAAGIANDEYPVSIDHTYYITVGQPE
jgi:hypothetical protein